MAQDTKPEQGRTTAKERYNALSAYREPFLRRAREFAKLTIPTLIPEEGTNNWTTLHQAYQSLGSRGVNNLAAKLLLALFPPNTPFFRLTLEDEVQRQMEESGLSEAQQEIEVALRRHEDKVLRLLEQKGARRTLNEVLKHLIVAGNVLLDVLADGGMRMHPISSYVVKRDGEGNPFEIIVVEDLDRRTLPENVLALLPEKPSASADTAKVDETVRIFTRAVRKGKKWEMWQEVEDIIIPKSQGSYPLEACPLIPLRWTKLDGQDYGRSHVEDLSGDLKSHEALSRSIALMSAAIAKILVFVDESGVTSIDDIRRAESLDILPGNARDITILQLEKQADLRVTKEHESDIGRRLAAAFLLNASIQRDAERVTAEEVRLLATELEAAIGGVYAVLAQELQLPLTRVYLGILKRGGKSELPDKYVNPTIITGLDALGRSSTVQKLERLAMWLNTTFGPTAAATYFNVGGAVKMFGAAEGLDLEGIIKTPEQLQQEQAQALAAKVAEKAAPQAMSAEAPTQPI